jgi:hypothetical protein
LTVPGVESSSSGLMTNDEEDSMSELYQSLSHSKWDGKYSGPQNSDQAIS